MTYIKYNQVFNVLYKSKLINITIIKYLTYYIKIKNV